jgi:iron complex outermembrane receptor protein
MKSTHLSLAIALAISAAAHPAFAQDAAPSNNDAAQTEAAKKAADAKNTLNAVTVTARRRAETAKDVPVAVSAFSEDGLKDLQATDISGLQGAVPNMNIVQGRGSANSVNVFIRGIGQPDALQTFDPGVGMYVDDVYYSRINGALFSLFDVGQVEVLRGPQGTLYGKNSTGGAIKISTKDPFVDAVRSVEMTAGSFGRLEGRFYMAGKLSDTFAASIAGGVMKNDGYVRNPTNGQEYNGDDTKAVRAKLAFRPSDAFDATLSLDYTKQDAPLTMGAATAPLTAVDLATGAVTVLQPAPGNYDYRARTSFAPGLGQKMTHSGASLNMTWHLSDAWALKSISAYRKLKTDSYIDIDASSFELGDVRVQVDQKQWSQELQLQYSSDTVNAIVGAYHLNENVPSHQEAYADDFLRYFGAKMDFLRTIDDDLHNKSSAVFANVDWKFAPTWALSGGIRYTRETKIYSRTTSVFYSAPFTALNGRDRAADINNRSQSWSAVTPSLSITKAFSDDMTAYISANRGFKSGGFNGRANNKFDADHAVFNPEYVWTYEAGLKMQSADRRYSANIAAFHSDYKDFQARVSEHTAPGSATFSFPVLNAASMKVDGLELEGKAVLGADKNTVVSTQIGWMHARYGEFNDPVTKINPTLANLHDHVPFSPKLSARLALQHTFDLGEAGGITFGADAAYRSRTWLSVDNRPALSQAGYTLFGMFGSWDSSDYAWQVRAGVRNLGDRKYKTEGQEFSSVGNIQTVYYGAPLNGYVSVRYNF